MACPSSPPASLLVFDEAHHFVAEQWGTIAAQYTDARIIGVTATPERSDGAPLGDLFDELVVVASVRELTDQSFLVPCSVIAPPKKRKTNAQSPLAAYREHAFGRPGVIFCASVKEARDVADQFTADGIASACVDGETDETVRADRLAAFERREISVLTNCFVLTEGWDAPIAEVCILARGCSSVGTFLQMVGRVLRPAPGKTDALLIDLRGVVHTHGLPDEERTFSLDGKPIGRGPTKKCHACETKIPLAAMVCPLCGEECPPARSLMGRFEAGEPLSRIDRAAIERAFWDEQIAEARRRGFKLGWAVHRFTEKFGRFPAKLWRELPCDVAPSTSTIREGAR